MLKYLTPGLAAAVLLGSAAYLAPLTGYAQGSPAPASQLLAPVAQTPAQKPGGPDQQSAQTPAPDRQMARANQKAFMDARIAALKAGLQLTPAQAPLWTPVETAIRDLATLRGRWMEAKHQDATLLPADKLKRRSEFMIQSGQALKTLADAASPLSASFDPAQKERLPLLLGAAFRHRPLLFAAFNVPGNERDGMRDRRGEMRGHDEVNHGEMGHSGMRHGDMEHGDLERGDLERGDAGRGERDSGRGSRMGRDGEDGGRPWNHERFGEGERGGPGGWRHHRHDSDGERDPT